MKNALGREIPERVGARTLKPYAGAFATPNEGRKAARWQKASTPTDDKVLHGIEAALDAVEVRDGMTLSFHHCFRNGDHVVNMVVDACARRGIRDLRLYATALFPVHEPLVEHIRNGVVTRIEGSMNGPVGAFVSQGRQLKEPAVLRSHGGRWRAVESGDVEIDVAFIAASHVDRAGNANGIFGSTPCGPISFAPVDAQYARKTVVVTNELAPYPVFPMEIKQGWVDHVCLVDAIGDADAIASGTLALTRSPTRLHIARLAAAAIKASGYLKEGFNFQGGAGGVSLAATKFVGDELQRAGIQGGFAMGGGTKMLVEQLHAGIIRCILDGQAFDKDAILSMQVDAAHVPIEVGQYANFDSNGCATYLLDAALLGATEVDLDFNVNVNTHSDGRLLHGIGGHQDVAAGARMTIITVPTLRGRVPVIMDRVTTVTTPGETVDVIVTERGVAVNPRREDLTERFLAAGLPVRGLGDMKKEADRLTRPPRRPVFGDEVIALIEWRDGTVIDAVREVVGWE